MEEIFVKDLREILEAAGVKLRKIRNHVVDSVGDGLICQKHQFSPVLVAGDVTINQFINHSLAKFKKTVADVDITLMSAEARKTYYIFTKHEQYG